MPIYKKESLESLRQRVDIVEVLSSHIELKPAGATYKALCPFHDEKTPSFVLNRGDSHYHCFGCGAHGDAIQFLMNYQKMSFTEAVESLAQKFGVHLEVIEGSEKPRGPATAKLKEALDIAARFYHFALLHTPEGHQALNYLYQRGLDLDFIRHFMIGLAPKGRGVFRKFMHSKFVSDEVMCEAGLLVKRDGKNVRDFFYDRITFPIHAPGNYVIGFSARKYKEDTFGGKYVNTPETPLFKKSRVLFGLNYCRRRIAKERKAIVVEGQVDALRLIQCGFNITVAGQGTAFGDGHVRELINLGVHQVYLALDSDNAGLEAASKIGNLFQKEGIDVFVTTLPAGSDPDSYLSQYGPEAMTELLGKSEDYLTFMVNYYSRNNDMQSPAAKNQMVQTLIQQIRQWDHPLMVHESLRKLAHLTHVPENIVGVGREHVPNMYIKKQASVGLQSIDPDRILESDLLRWLLLVGGSLPWLVEVARENLPAEEFHVRVCRDIYQAFMENTNKEHTCDLLQLASVLDDAEGQLVLGELLQKKVNKDKAEEFFIETVQKILNRNWMEKREEIKIKIHSGKYEDAAVLELVKQFDELKREPPKVIIEKSEAVAEEPIHAEEASYVL
jgi:DNA primase